MRLLAISAFCLAFVVSIAWFTFKPAYDSAAAVAAALAALIASFFLQRDRSGREQNQQVSGRSVGVQAGRDANVRDVKK